MLARSRSRNLKSLLVTRQADTGTRRAAWSSTRFRTGPGHGIPVPGWRISGGPRDRLGLGCTEGWEPERWQTASDSRGTPRNTTRCSERRLALGTTTALLTG